MKIIQHIILTLIAFISPTIACAQIGEHRNDLSIGVSAGYNMSNVRFVPKITQSSKGGLTGGLIVRYTCEKYFSTICAIQAEVNYAQVGWKENILNAQDEPVMTLTGDAQEAYERTINYVQVPLLAHLAWGREYKGVNFFFNAGPQFGFVLSESTKTNFTPETANRADRVSTTMAQDTMAVENKFDYGIMAGLGLEFATKHAGRFQVEARYYYGLGNIYGDSKRDFFGASNHSVITIRGAYLFDLFTYKKK